MSYSFRFSSEFRISSRSQVSVPKIMSRLRVAECVVKRLFTKSFLFGRLRKFIKRLEMRFREGGRLEFLPTLPGLVGKFKLKSLGI